MIPDFDDDGNLSHGIYWASWEEFKQRFGITPHRKRLLSGLKAALLSLQTAGCQSVYLDGSFVTAKHTPGDFDGCWDPNGVDPFQLDPILLRFDNGCFAQKIKYFGELFLASTQENQSGLAFLDFFQTDKNTGTAKGIIALKLQGITL